ncbi:hypothetical protein IJG04_01410 [Candidatus Saccharibacteria bacterium]|nr:hypothetical protein [Candidatus Saccharibacteria bacterium]
MKNGKLSPALLMIVVGAVVAIVSLSCYFILLEKTCRPYNFAGFCGLGYFSYLFPFFALGITIFIRGLVFEIKIFFASRNNNNQYNHIKDLNFFQMFTSTVWGYLTVVSGAVLIISAFVLFGKLLNGTADVRAQANDTALILHFVVSFITFLSLVLLKKYYNKHRRK